jgi:hypothetical protein
MRDHERIEELIAVRALGGLDGGDDLRLREERAGHGPDCSECRRLEAEYAEVAGRLGFALDPVPLPVGFEDSVVASATAERRRLVAVDGAPRARRGARPGPRGINLRPLVAIAASIVLFAAGLGLGGLLAGGDPVPDDARVVAFEGERGSLAVAYEPGKPGLYLLGSGLATPPQGRVYEIWLIEGDRPVPARCFRPAPDGSVFAFVDAELGSADTMAVTLEPAACSERPTSAPILTAEIA